jgi:hypothetical protein
MMCGGWRTMFDRLRGTNARVMAMMMPGLNFGRSGRGRNEDGGKHERRSD